MKIFVLYILYIGIGLLPFQEEDRLFWSKDYSLQWSDYLGNVPKSSKFDATSNVGITAPCEYSNGILEADVICYLNKKKSWVKSKSEILLKHEQGHFDISEIYARKLRQQLSCYKFKRKTIKSDYYKLYNKNKKELDIRQDLYDKETELSHNEIKQEEWTKKIATELNALDEYSNTHLTIKVK